MDRYQDIDMDNPETFNFGNGYVVAVYGGNEWGAKVNEKGTLTFKLPDPQYHIRSVVRRGKGRKDLELMIKVPLMGPVHHDPPRIRYPHLKVGDNTHKNYDRIIFIKHKRLQAMHDARERKAS